MNTAFQSEPILLIDWAYCIGVGVAIYAVIELEKIIQNKFLHKISFLKD
jgi:hypothetical protein